MKIFRSKEKFLVYRSGLDRNVRNRGRIGFVATMGSLHAGHTALIKRSVRENAHTIVSIFVNPTQFAPHEDFASYPRDETGDLRLIRACGVQSVFIPRGEDIYPGNDKSVFIDHKELTGKYDGVVRPHFFSGGMTVIAKFFNIVRPDRAYFGKKDYQQLYLFRELVRALAYPIKIYGVATVRERTGLAMSSRNAYLAAAGDIEAAAYFYQLLLATKKHVFTSAVPLAATKVVTFFKNGLKRYPWFKLDYVAVVDRKTLVERKFVDCGRSVILAAVFFLDRRTAAVKVRLIDNIEL
ncbi:pantothenate synthetase [Spirochaetota bacterium]|nr:pantothenate synthetase [Spirochaetota bacterium]